MQNGQHTITLNSTTQVVRKDCCLSDWLERYNLFEENVFCGKKKIHSMEIAQK